jgi:allantoinase
MADKVFTGEVVLADRVIDNGYVLVGDGKIQAIGSGPVPAGDKHGGPGFLVMPGAIDAQVHSRSQLGQEDFIWSTRSAAAGGVTTIVDMPYDDNCLIASAERFRTKIREAGAQARVDFALYATVDPEEGAARVDEAKGITDYTAHGLSRPPVTEALATAEVYELGAATGCPVHIVHSSIGRGYELAAAYRAQGHGATIEACVHYLTLDEENDVRRLGGKAKINPPLRPRREVEALWHHLAAGNVTIVSTDHVSWSEDRKTDPNMLKNSSGIPGLEVLYALLLKGLDARKLPLTHAARLLALNPAVLFRITHLKGALEVGRDADVVLMRRDPYRYSAAASGNNFVSWSPYDGIELPFKAVATFVRGQCVAADGGVMADPGSGRFVSPLRMR